MGPIGVFLRCTGRDDPLEALRNAKKFIERSLVEIGAA